MNYIESRFIFFALMASLFLSACGTAGSACVDQNFETHLDQKHSAPDNVQVMLHHANKSCAAPGDNRFHVYLIEDSAEGEHSIHSKPDLYPVAMTEDDMHTHDMDEEHAENTGKVAISAVSGWMPAHGHGTAVDPVVDAGDSSLFDITFQMPGTWEMTVEFVAQTVTHTTQSVTFTVNVTE